MDKLTNKAGDVIAKLAKRFLPGKNNNSRSFISNLIESTDANIIPNDLAEFRSNNNPQPDELKGTTTKKGRKTSSLDKTQMVRETWSGKLDFLMSAIGYSAGLGNVWRFPAMAGKNGGGAFLVPYFLLLMFVGIPIFFIEITLGQFSSSGPIKVWKVIPLAQGIGYGMIFIQSMVNLYYNIIMTWVLFYFFASFNTILPWSECNKPWNTPDCFSIADYSLSLQCNATNGVYYRHECRHHNITLFQALGNVSPRISPSEEFFNNKMLRPSGSITNFGGIHWTMALTLLCSWIIVYLIIIRGIKSSGKVVYFTATFPYFVLLILVVKGATLKGAMEGIRFYIYPNWKRILDLDVWTDAAAQMFFSLSCGMGGLQALSSYNKFNNNVLRDTWIVTMINSFTSVFAGFAIFSIIGNMSLIKQMPVDDIAASGTGLAFIVYPEALLYLPVPTVWSLIFFFMLFTLGIDSQFAGVETVCTTILDAFKIHHVGKWKKSGVTLLVCVAYFFLSLPLVSRSGIYWVELFNSFSTNWGLIFITLLEGSAIAYIYGTKNFISDIEMMIGQKSKYRWAWWTFVWMVSPLILGAFFVISWFKIKPLTYGTYIYPRWANYLGWVIAVIPVLFVPLLIIKNYITNPNPPTSFFKNMAFLSRPKYNWGPALNQNRTGRYKPIPKEENQDEEFTKENEQITSI